MIAPVTLNGEVHQCLPFYKRLVSCINTTVLPGLECKLFNEDFQECRHGLKQKKIDFMIQHEKSRQNVIRLPVYDAVTDKFVSDFERDGDKIFLRGAPRPQTGEAEAQQE